MLTKALILEILNKFYLDNQEVDVVSSGSIKNIVIYGNEINVDLEVTNPTLKSKNIIRENLLSFLKSNIDQKIELKINFIVGSSKKKENKIYNPQRKISNISNIIAISSAKGGVGKSTVTANLAVSLSKMGFNVGVLDSDIYGPSMPIMFDVEEQKPLAVTIDGKSKMKPIENYGVKILSIGFFTKKDEAVIWRGPMASKALNQMIFDAAWGELDFLLVDLPPGTGDIHLSIMQSLPVTGSVIVSTPQNVALADAKKGVAMFRQESINVPVLGIIENMAYFTPEELPENKYYIFGREGAKNLAKDIEAPFLGEIPLVQSLRESGDIGRPAAMQESTPLEEAFEEITRGMVQETVNRNQSLPPTEAIKITTMAGCSAVNKK